MFERYNEKARRVIFFARHEASGVGSLYIESEHLLIGLMRDGGHQLIRSLGSTISADELRAEIAAAIIRRSPTSTRVDLPLSNECKGILAYAVEEADRLAHKHIGTEHLLLGVLRETDCLAARLLRRCGMTLDAARTAAAAGATERGTGSDIGSGPACPKGRAGRGFRMIDQESGETLLNSEESPMVPRVDDTILIGGVGKPDMFYHVKQVLWEFFGEGDQHRLHGLLVKVVKANPAGGVEVRPRS